MRRRLAAFLLAVAMPLAPALPARAMARASRMLWLGVATPGRFIAHA
jgi:hypothetical protein